MVAPTRDGYNYLLLFGEDFYVFLLTYNPLNLIIIPDVKNGPEKGAFSFVRRISH